MKICREAGNDYLECLKTPPEHAIARLAAAVFLRYANH